MKKIAKLLLLTLVPAFVAGCTMSDLPIGPTRTSRTTSAPTSEPTTAPTSEPTSAPTTSISTSILPSESTSDIPTTTSDIPTSVITSDSTTSVVPTSEPTSISTSVSTSISTSEPTTSSPTSVPTSESTSVPSEQSVLIPLSSNPSLPFAPQGGIHIDDDGYTDKRDQFLAYMNEMAGFEVISSISASNTFIQPSNSTNLIVTNLHFTIGSSSAGGSITFNFSVNVKKAVLKCCAYYKIYNGGMTVDSDSTVIFNNETIKLPAEENIVPRATTHEANYGTPVTSLSLSNTGDHQRCFIESLELFY